MTEQLKEQLSAFIDDELSEAETALLVRRLGSDAGLRRDAIALLQVSQLLRGEHSAAGAQFAAAVSARLNDEPLPAATVPDAPPTAPGGWLRLAAGGGIAAAVAIAVLASLPGQLGPDGDAGGTALMSETGETAGASETTLEEYVVPEAVPAAGLVSADPELAAYFLSHSASGVSLAPGSGRARMLVGEQTREDDAELDTAEIDVEAARP